MKRFAYPLVILAACLPFQAQAGDNPSPALLAKIQLATQAYQNADSAAKEAKMVRSLRAPDSAPAIEGNGRIKQVGALKVDKLIPGPRTPAAIGKAIGNHANDGDQD
jgi:hypothetical protein